MDALDRTIINELQGGFPIADRPYAEWAEKWGTSEQELLRRIKRLLEDGVLSRFGPMYHAERLGGALSLCAMRVPSEDFERVVEQVNEYPEVAHNYERDHAMNMWFVLATETPEAIDSVIRSIENVTGLKVYNMPKEEEYYVGLRLTV